MYQLSFQGEYWRLTSNGLPSMEFPVEFPMESHLNLQDLPPFNQFPIAKRHRARSLRENQFPAVARRQHQLLRNDSGEGSSSNFLWCHQVKIRMRLMIGFITFYHKAIYIHIYIYIIIYYIYTYQHMRIPRLNRHLSYFHRQGTGRTSAFTA